MKSIIHLPNLITGLEIKIDCLLCSVLLKHGYKYKELNRLYDTLLLFNAIKYIPHKCIISLYNWSIVRGVSYYEVISGCYSYKDGKWVKIMKKKHNMTLRKSNKWWMCNHLREWRYTLIWFRFLRHALKLYW